MPSTMQQPRIGLVLGAGGTVGIAWLVGALAALQRTTGWNPADADILAGTSAGSVVAAVLAAGIDPMSLLEMAEDSSALDAAIDEATAGRDGLRPTLAWPGSLALGLTGLLAGDSHRRVSSLLGFLPRGLRSTGNVRGLTYAAVKDGWPAGRSLWVHACDYRSGRRVVFGREGAPEAELADAVAASCAVPGYYTPVRIGDRLYADGGLWSFTNADTLAGEDVDVVLCLSPTSARERGSLTDRAAMGALRRSVGARLRREADILREDGIEVVTLEPGADDIAAMGLNPMGISRARRVVETAVESTTTALAGLDLDALAPAAAPMAPAAPAPAAPAPAAPAPVASAPAALPVAA